MMEGRIKIGSNPIVTLDSLSMYIADADKIFCAPQMDYEKQYFPEIGKATIYPHTADKPFEYKIKIGVLGSINERIGWLNSQCKGKVVEFYNDYTNTKIVGYLKTIPPADKYHPTVATFDIVIDVNDPSKCDFNL